MMGDPFFIKKVMMLRWLALAVIVITLILLYKFYKMAKAKGYSGFISFVISIISGSLFLFVLYAGITLWDGAWMSKRTYTKLCETSSKNEVYDQEAWDRYNVALGQTYDEDGNFKNDWSKDYEEPVRDVPKGSLQEKILNDNNKSSNRWVMSGYLPIAGFARIGYSYNKYDECENKDCFKSESKLYDLKTGKLIEHVVYFAGNPGKIMLLMSPVNNIYSKSCRDLRIGAFKKRM